MAKKSKNKNKKEVKTKIEREESIGELMERVLAGKSEIEIYDITKHCKDIVELREFLLNY